MDLTLSIEVVPVLICLIYILYNIEKMQLALPMWNPWLQFQHCKIWCRMSNWSYFLVCSLLNVSQFLLNHVLLCTMLGDWNILLIPVIVSGSVYGTYQVGVLSGSLPLDSGSGWMNMFWYRTILQPQSLLNYMFIFLLKIMCLQSLADTGCSCISVLTKWHCGSDCEF